MPIVVKKIFPYDKFKPSTFQGKFTDEMFNALMSRTKRIQPDVKDIVRQYLVDGKSFKDFEGRTKQSVYIRVRYYLQLGINAGIISAEK